MMLPTSLKSRVLSAAHRRPSPTRAELRLPASARAALAALAMLAALFAWGGPDHALGRPGSVGAPVVLGVVALATAVTWCALPARRSMLPPPDSRLLAVALGVPLLVGAWLIAWHSAYDDPFSRTGLRCFALTLAAAPGPFLALLAAGPRLAPSQPRLAGAAVGAVSGAWAAVVVELWCPLALPAHVMSGHVLPLVVLAAAGAVFGPRLLGLRRV
jgi:hypothetical protein